MCFTPWDLPNSFLFSSSELASGDVVFHDFQFLNVRVDEDKCLFEVIRAHQKAYDGSREILHELQGQLLGNTVGP